MQLADAPNRQCFVEKIHTFVAININCQQKYITLQIQLSRNFRNITLRSVSVS